MSRIGLIIKGKNGRSEYHYANVKPFVDFGYGLRLIGEEAILFIDDSEVGLTEKINSITNGEINLVYYNASNLFRLIEQNKLNFLLVDDDIELMEDILKLEDNSIKKAVYVQYLYGVNTNKKSKRDSSMKLKIGSNFPWKFIIKKYRNLISKFDFIIPNSQTCSYILRQFYDILPSNTVYPPVGVDMRNILKSKNTEKTKRGLLVFAGDINNDHFSRNILKEIEEFKMHVDEPVRLFVSNSETSKFFSNNGFDVYSKLPVKDLINLYMISKVTYVPTTYELFGYVGAESLLCGTNVILDIFHPFLECVPIESNAVRISNPNSKIYSLFLEFENKPINMQLAKNSIQSNYSAEESAKSLLLNLKNK